MPVKFGVKIWEYYAVNDNNDDDDVTFIYCSASSSISEQDVFIVSYKNIRRAFLIDTVIVLKSCNNNLAYHSHLKMFSSSICYLSTLLCL